MKDSYLDDIEAVRAALVSGQHSVTKHRAQEAFGRLEELLKKFGVVQPTPGRRAYNAFLEGSPGATPTNSYWENIAQSERDRWEHIAQLVIGSPTTPPTHSE